MLPLFLHTFNLYYALQGHQNSNQPMEKGVSRDMTSQVFGHTNFKILVSLQDQSFSKTQKFPPVEACYERAAP
jgi:hypothetical protein